MHEFSILLSEERKNVLRRRVKISADENHAETLRSKGQVAALISNMGLRLACVKFEFEHCSSQSEDRYEYQRDEGLGD
ncbi:unnamed protein product [Hymenolepis diminuta]|uniref:Uncharacterized protein n=1 Tax=Hymenolepis diminuta TaxID=6216 RepID=A0A564Y715_HYMDI|nr:unnamed protein product [Hymenolepis diminuta]